MKTMYHATTINRWAEAVTSVDAWVHIGSYKSAFERAHRVTRNGLQILESHYLHMMEINDDARVYPGYVEDMDENWESLNTENWDAFQYINQHESPGEVSVYLRAKVLHSIRIADILSPTV